MKFVLAFLIGATTVQAQSISISGRGQEINLNRPQTTAPPLVIWEQPKDTNPKDTKPDTRPVTTMFVTDDCVWCNIGKAELAKQSKELPFQIKIVHTNSGDVPNWVEAYPTFYWRASDKSYRQRKGWPGVEPLISSWRLTQGELRQSQNQKGYVGNGTTRWTFPGTTRASLIRHLQDGRHSGKFTNSQLNQMTFEELQQLHSDDHAGQVAWGQLPACPPGRT